MTHDIPGHARFVGVYYLPVDVRILRMPLPKRGILHKPLGWVQAVPGGGGGRGVLGEGGRRVLHGPGWSLGTSTKMPADNGIGPQGMGAFPGVPVPCVTYCSLRTGELEMLHSVALS